MFRANWNLKASVKSQKPIRYKKVDGLRAISVLLVVLAHSGFGNYIPGGTGVTFFFVISGFVITNLVLFEFSESSDFDIRRFYIQRSLKLFPPLVAVVILPTFVYSFFANVDWGVVLSQIFFFYNWTFLNIKDEVLPGSALVWSLAIEEQFYLMFSLLWLLLLRTKEPVRWLFVIAIVVAVLSAATRMLYFLQGFPSERIYFGTDTRIEAIAIGVCAALFYRFAKSVNWLATLTQFRVNLLSLALVFMLAFSFVVRDDLFRETARYTVQSLTFACIMLILLCRGDVLLTRTTSRFLESNWIQRVGLASYSIYLSHLCLMKLLQPYCAPLGSFFTGIVLSSMAIIFGMVLYRLIEIPALKFRRRIEGKAF